jgi:hypothetical protein
MSPDEVTRRLRRFLLLVAGFLCAGTVVELLLIGHTKSLTQLLPFLLCLLGIAAVAGVLLRPKRFALVALRVVMGVLILGSLFGIYEHVEHNLDFALEIQPNAAYNTLVLKALGGANPLLAPGMLALAGMLALMATYYHPGWEQRRLNTSEPLAVPLPEDQHLTNYR